MSNRHPKRPDCSLSMGVNDSALFFFPSRLHLLSGFVARPLPSLSLRWNAKSSSEHTEAEFESRHVVAPAARLWTRLCSRDATLSGRCALRRNPQLRLHSYPRVRNSADGAVRRRACRSAERQHRRYALRTLDGRFGSLVGAHFKFLCACAAARGRLELLRERFSRGAPIADGALSAWLAPVCARARRPAAPHPGARASGRRTSGFMRLGRLSVRVLIPFTPLFLSLACLPRASHRMASHRS